MDWTPPSQDRIFAATEATWPAAFARRIGPWLVREGQGGGSRVSAATLAEVGGAQDGGDWDIAQAEAAMAALGQAPLFSVRGGQDGLDRALEAAGYEIGWPTVALAAPIAALEGTQPMKAIPCAAPLARGREIWAEGGIGPERLAVMDRVAGPKTYLMGRIEDRPAGSAFVAVDGEVAMVHALEVAAHKRRTGAGRAMTARAGEWAAAEGAEVLCLLVTEANTAARALYGQMGFVEAGRYHYRRR